MAGRGAAPGERRGGRAKGTVNKDKRALLDKIQAEFPGYDPVMAMVKIARDEENVDLGMRFAAHKEVAQYVTPKLKAIDHVHRGDAQAPMVVEMVTFETGDE